MSTSARSPNDKTVDSFAAIQKCFDAAKAQKKSAWIPSGTFYVNSGKGLHARDITVEGAGMWYSAIYRAVPLPAAHGVASIFEPVSCTVRNLFFDQNAPGRSEADGDGGGINIKGENWLVEKVWVQHTASGVWGDGENGLVRDWPHAQHLGATASTSTTATREHRQQPDRDQ